MPQPGQTKHPVSRALEKRNTDNSQRCPEQHGDVLGILEEEEISCNSVPHFSANDLAQNLTSVAHQHWDDEGTVVELFSTFYDQTLGVQSPSEGSLEIPKHARFTETWHPAFIGNCASKTKVEHRKEYCNHQKNLKEHRRISASFDLHERRKEEEERPFINIYQS